MSDVLIIVLVPLVVMSLLSVQIPQVTYRSQEVTHNRSRYSVSWHLLYVGLYVRFWYCGVLSPCDTLDPYNATK